MSDVAGAILRAGNYVVTVKPSTPDVELRTWIKNTTGADAPGRMWQWAVTLNGEPITDGYASTQENAILGAGMAIGEHGARPSDREEPRSEEWLVTEMEAKPEGLIRVWESGLASPMGPCESIRERMRVAGIDAMVWRPEDHTGEAVYVWAPQLEAAQQWIKDHLFA